MPSDLVPFDLGKWNATIVVNGQLLRYVPDSGLFAILAQARKKE